MEEPDDDSCTIAEMELEYLGVVSTWEDQYRESMVMYPCTTLSQAPRGPTKTTTACWRAPQQKFCWKWRLLSSSLTTTLGTGPLDRQWHLNSSQVVPRTENPHALELFLGKPSTTES